MNTGEPGAIGGRVDQGHALELLEVPQSGLLFVRRERGFLRQNQHRPAVFIERAVADDDKVPGHVAGPDILENGHRV